MGRRDSECAIVHKEAMSAFSRAISARTEATVGVTGVEGTWARETDTSANAHSAQAESTTTLVVISSFSWHHTVGTYLPTTIPPNWKVPT